MPIVDLNIGAPVIEMWWYPLLLLAGWCAGFVDSAAGGGGLITVPVLLQTGMPPQWALATNKLQATFGSGSACLHFARAQMIDWNTAWVAAAFTLAGAVAGASLVAHLDAEGLKRLIPWLLAGLAIYTWLQPNLGDSRGAERISGQVFAPLCGLGIGFYDGFFGPGTGSFWAMAYVMLRGFDLRSATAHTKLMNFASNIAALVVFLAAGKVLYAAGFCMGLGQWFGARAGSKLVIRHGAKWVRPLLIGVTLFLTARLLWLNYRAGL